MFTLVVHTEIDVAAPPRAVWAVLSDLEAYPAWNPMIRRASGELRPGARLVLFFSPPGSRGRTFRPTLLSVEPSRRLCWRGQPGVPLLFESEHLFFLEELPGHGTRLRHDMAFRGLLVPLAKKSMDRATREPFTLMNRALKRRAEEIFSQEGRQ